ncbi:hypothetical protein CVT26_002339 [Gymnopilus dilepis]|uniref:TEA domain-containing protein n=1 Tax=Gymnopilus dilepis TaxID=231916 RepID=A0A409Y3D0_9AGAR|nr:hypothetical protein CVT26_002339 [Gymnopilus dilepis]
MDTGRRTNKFNKSKEKVWPDYMEKALLDALEIYFPQSTKDPTALQRFPARNKFISEYIFKVTGKRRTAKQVGSRLQQLRETCTDQYVLDLIQSKNFDQRPRRGLMPAERTPSTSSLQTIVEWNSSESSSLPSSETGNLSRLSSAPSSDFAQDNTPSSSSCLPPYCLTTFLIVYISLFAFDFCAAQPTATPSFTLDLDEHPLTNHTGSSMSTFHRHAEIRSPQAIPQCRPIVNFSSRRFIPDSFYQCVTDVRRGCELVYSAPALLERRGSIDGPPVLSMPFLPDFWAVITSDPEDYRSYTIDQRIYSIATGNDVPRTDFPMFSILYTMEIGINPPSYIAPETHPPPYLGDLSFHHNLIPFQFPTEGHAATYHDANPLVYAVPQLPDPSFFSLQGDLLSTSPGRPFTSFFGSL